MLNFMQSNQNLFINNHYVKYTDIKAYFIQDEKIFINKMKDDLTNNKYFYHVNINIPNGTSKPSLDFETNFLIYKSTPTVSDYCIVTIIIYQNILPSFI